MGFMSEFMNGFLGRPSLPAGTGPRLTAADRPARLGLDWQPAVLEFMTAEASGPATAQVFVRVAGVDAPDEAVAFVFPTTGEVTHVRVDDVVDATWRVLTAPVGLIGFGAAGILAAGIAHAADRAMSVWKLDMLLYESMMTASFKVQREPDDATLARLRARLELHAMPDELVRPEPPVTARPVLPPPSARPAGWYPDRKDPSSGRRQWWNGTAWTSYVYTPKDGAPVPRLPPPRAG